jgi:hypothetical protein
VQKKRFVAICKTISRIAYEHEEKNQREASACGRNDVVARDIDSNATPSEDAPKG